jgi:hypothetical protein
LSDDLTRPEKSAAFSHARQFVKRELARGNACALCTHRDRDYVYWGLSRCATNHARAFPLCAKDGQQPSFDLDESTVKGKIHG